MPQKKMIDLNEAIAVILNLPLFMNGVDYISAEFSRF